jgi:hypothetical protein
MAGAGVPLLLTEYCKEPHVERDDLVASATSVFGSFVHTGPG